MARKASEPSLELCIRVVAMLVRWIQTLQAVTENENENENDQ
jgi:hypothetical protein